MLAAWYQPALFVLFFLTCILLILIVLLQKGRGGGLSGAFGGAGSSAFGARTGDFLTWVTIVLTVMFLLLAIVTSLAFRPTATDVAAPVFDPAPPGEIGMVNLVSMSTATVGATIWYQVDDNEPAIFRGGDEQARISVPVGSAITAWAERAGEGWKTSPKVSAVYGVAPVLPGEEELLDNLPESLQGVTPPQEEPTDNDNTASQHNASDPHPTGTPDN